MKDKAPTLTDQIACIEKIKTYRAFENDYDTLHAVIDNLVALKILNRLDEDMARRHNAAKGTLAKIV